MDILRRFKCETWGRVIDQAEEAWKATSKAILPLRLDYHLLDSTKAYAPDWRPPGTKINVSEYRAWLRRLRRLWNAKRYELLIDE